LEIEPAASHDSTPPDSESEEPAPAVPTRDTTPVWAQPSAAVPAEKKGDPDWTKSAEGTANGGAEA